LSAYLTAINTLRTTHIQSVKTESETTKTFVFKDSLCSRAKPGQFLMLWIPGIDEIPLSIQEASRGQVSVTVKGVGEATRALHEMKPGQVVGVRGPFGNWFTENPGRVLMIGGGTGTAPLLFLAKKLASKVQQLSFIMGAKTKKELLFQNELTSICTQESILTTTEDGSHGLQCLATEPLQKLIENTKFDIIYTCGPELMVRKVYDIAKISGLNVEASLERLMRCGIGLCGSCMIGKYRVCKDGPVFNMARLAEVEDELGLSKLGFDGERIPV
jgi:dihydroorotate dehydrogenase electron transfer subunit